MVCAWNCRRGFGRWWRQATATGCKNKLCNNVFATHFHVQNHPRPRRVRKQHSSSAAQHNTTEDNTAHRTGHIPHGSARRSATPHARTPHTRQASQHTAWHNAITQHNTTRHDTTQTAKQKSMFASTHGSRFMCFRAMDFHGVPPGFRRGSAGDPEGFRICLKGSAMFS